MLANKTFLFVDQISPDFFRGTREKSVSITFLSDFGCLETYAIKVDSYQISRRILDVFCPAIFLGGGFQKLYTYTASGHVVW